MQMERAQENVREDVNAGKTKIQAPLGATRG
jgi:hypothetical protein